MIDCNFRWQHTREKQTEMDKKRNSRKSRNDQRKSGKKDYTDEGFEEVGIESDLTGDSLTFQDEVNDLGMDSDSELADTRKLVQQQNRKKKKSGGFQSMGLSHFIYKGIIKKGYKIPTPIQRKTIPLILDGKDVVAMARTGSGKTAAFLIPLFEKLKIHSAQAGARAIILAPTRELALQTLTFTKEIGKYTGLKAAVILGGDKMEDQFAALHENPDIIIATPGRFMHVLVEMELKLASVEYVVFDEADRLFEMGFQEQLHEILSRLPENRQTLLFSATLPKLLVDFAKAGLHDPTLVRLDVDTKLSEQLKLSFLHCRHEDRTAALLFLLRNVIKPSEQTVVFVATKHHAEYLNMLLKEAGINCSYSYSALDQTARKIQVAKFRSRMTRVLVVTDLAARGIDIPMLDNVINLNFPAKPKLFVHRVGRVARAGRIGTAYSLVSSDEMPYVLDLHLFLGRTLKIAYLSKQKDEDGLVGRVPQSVIDDEDENLRIWTKKTDLANMGKVIDNAYKQYIRSRPAPSSESVKRYKLIKDSSMGFHPLYAKSVAYSDDLEESKADFMERMRNYKPQSTIFEVNATKKGSSLEMMKRKRDRHRNFIVFKQKQNVSQQPVDLSAESKGNNSLQVVESSEADIEAAFSKVVAPKSHPPKEKIKSKRRQVKIVDEEHFISHKPKDTHTEKGLSLGTSFDLEAANATMDLIGDDQQQTRSLGNAMRWDRKKKKFIRDDNEGKKKKVKTESGSWVRASYKANLYKDWLEKNKMTASRARGSDDDDDDDDDDDAGPPKKKARMQAKAGRFQVLGEGGNRGRGFYHTTTREEAKQKGPGRREMRTKEQILKERRKKSKLQNFQKFRSDKHQKGKRSGKTGGSRGGRGGRGGGQGGGRRGKR